MVQQSEPKRALSTYGFTADEPASSGTKIGLADVALLGTFKSRILKE